MHSSLKNLYSLLLKYKGEIKSQKPIKIGEDAGLMLKISYVVGEVVYSQIVLLFNFDKYLK